MLDPALKQSWKVAPTWAVDAGFLGRAFVLLALFSFLSAVTFWALSPKKPSFAAWGKRAFIIGGFSLFGTIICLGSLFANDQFEYTYVFSHGDASTELKYKIAGIWSGQQGSFLLWACTSSIFGMLAARFAGIYRRWFTIVFAVFLATLCGILAYETPFELAPLIHGVEYVAPFGAGLPPSLMNYWVIIHPPTIFMGFGSLTVAFAYGMSAMLTRNVKDWIPMVRPWVILSTSILGLGLSMGGFWAYETLGWGGFWLWDPVENVSFVPWIFSIALLHGFIVQASKKRWVNGNLALAGLPFITFCYGTFLTRSGFLADASVHSFAEMNRVALWILASFVVLAAIVYYSTYGFLGVKLAKADSVPPNPEKGVDREGLYQSGVLLLSGLAAAVAIGMSIPFYLSLAHKNSKVVEEPLYFQVVVWFFLPIMVLMGIAPFVGWRKTGWKEVLNKLLNVFAITFGVLGLILMALKAAPEGVQTAADATVVFPKIPAATGSIVLIVAGFGACVANALQVSRLLKSPTRSTAHLAFYLAWFLPLLGLVVYGVIRFLEHQRMSSVSRSMDYLIGHSPPLVPWVMVLISVCLFCFVANAWRVIETYKRAKMSIGGFIAHMGIATLLAGLIISRGLQKEDLVHLQEGDEVTSMGYKISYDGMTHPGEDGIRDRDNKVKFLVSGPNGGFEARPGMYVIPQNDGPDQYMVWPHVEHMGTHDLYFELGQPQNDVWEQPESFQPGETRAPSIDDKGPGPIAITYNGFKMEGKGGGVGTKFVGDIVVRVTNNDGSISAHAVKPTIAITASGMELDATPVDDSFFVTMDGINPADHSAKFQVHFTHTVYSLDIFYKPMVILVWLGAAITFLGGVLAAYSRRIRAKTAPSDREIV